jgi:CHAD domain
VAKPRRVEGLDPDDRLLPNARRLLAVRIDEVYSYDGPVRDPANITQLHDMRIACKRLRYVMEIFGIAFDSDLEPELDQIKELQDLLGDIHDCDVQVPMLEAHLAWLTSREAGAARRLVTETAETVTAAGASEEEFRAFQHRLEVGRRGAERLGVHALIGRRRRERNELYARFIGEWERMAQEDFRDRLEAALGISRDA